MLIFPRKRASQNDLISRVAIEVMDFCNRAESALERVESGIEGAQRGAKQSLRDERAEAKQALYRTKQREQRSTVRFH